MLMVVNGAGLAMATNDTIDLLYGKSANFLDVGGKATPETIKEAFRLVLKNRDVWSWKYSKNRSMLFSLISSEVVSIISF